MLQDAEDYVLKVENLKAFYTSKKGLVKAVNNISFGIRKGESVGLFGESGAGKTSVALSIMGIFDEVSRFYASTASDPENKKLWEKKNSTLGVEFGSLGIGNVRPLGRPERLCPIDCQVSRSKSLREHRSL